MSAVKSKILFFVLLVEDREKESLKIVLKVGGNREQSPDVYSQSSHEDRKHKHKKKKKKKSGERDRDRSKQFGVGLVSFNSLRPSQQFFSHA